MMSEDDYSDLTDLDSGDYEEKPKKKAAGQKGGGHGGGSGGYRIKNALKPPRATTYTAQALYDGMHSQDVKLDPEYQRDVVWPETKQIGLIDSVFRNFYIPPIIFAVTSHEDGSETKICIDGKQRLTSIHRFMDGLIPHKDPQTNEKLWYKEPAGKTNRNTRMLPERYRRLFANKQIVCVEYQDITDSDEREIFQRVQLGMALTPAEKLQVISTSRASFIRSLQSSFLRDSSALAGDALDWDRSRGSDFRCLAQIVYCIDNWGPSLKGAGSIVKLEKWLSGGRDFSEEFKRRVEEGFRLFSDIAQDKKLGRTLRIEKYAGGKVSPIEFICIGLLVGACGVGFGNSNSSGNDNNAARLSKEELSQAIGKMRDEVRDVHVDIRLNDRVAKTMLDFIRNIIPGGSSSGSTSNGTSAGGGLKRKREQEQEQRDDRDENVNGGKPKKQSIPTPAPPQKPTPSLPNKPPLSVTNRALSSTSRASASVKLSSSKPNGPDRMAAVHAAKAQTADKSLMQAMPIAAPVSTPTSRYMGLPSPAVEHVSTSYVNNSTGDGRRSPSGPNSFRHSGMQQPATTPPRVYRRPSPEPSYNPHQYHYPPTRPGSNRERLEHPPTMPYDAGGTRRVSDERRSSMGTVMGSGGRSGRRSGDWGWVGDVERSSSRGDLGWHGGGGNNNGRARW